MTSSAIEIPACGVCGGPRKVCPDGHRWCPPCQKRRAQARRRRLQEEGNDLVASSTAWAKRLEADPELYHRLCLQARDGQHDAVPDHRLPHFVPRVYRVAM